MAAAIDDLAAPRSRVALSVSDQTARSKTNLTAASIRPLMVNSALTVSFLVTRVVSLEDFSS